MLVVFSPIAVALYITVDVNGWVTRPRGSDEPDEPDMSESSEASDTSNSDSAESALLPYFGCFFFGSDVHHEDGEGGSKENFGVVIAIGVGGSSSAAWYRCASGRPRAFADVLQLRPEAYARLRVDSGPTGDRWRLGHGGARRTWLTVRAVVFAWGIYASLSPHGGEYRWPARGARAADSRAGFRLQDRWCRWWPCRTTVIGLGPCFIW